MTLAPLAYTTCQLYNLLVTSTDILKALKADGWIVVDVSGSHHQLKHPSKPGRVTVPHPKKDIPTGTVKSIERQSGVRLR